MPAGRGQRDSFATVKQVNQRFVLILSCNQKNLRCRKPVYRIYVAIGQKKLLTVAGIAEMLEKEQWFMYHYCRC
jgi:F0F1-type ATP synthase alpha subunit